MPKLITFTDLLPPTGVTASVKSGGTLASGSTYYYVIQACFDAGTSVFTTNGRSLSSTEVSASTTSGNQTIEVSWSASAGAGGYRVYRATSSEGYEQMLNYAVRTSVDCTNGICKITDNGIGNPGNTIYQNVAHGKIQLSGSTISDPFSITDLYSASQAGGWGVVDSLDESTYIVKSYLVGHSGLYWVDIDKAIVFRDYIFAGGNDNYRFGDKTGLTTSRGCRLIFKNPDLNTTIFATLNAYKTTFDYVGTFNTVRAYTNITPYSIVYNSGSIEFCLINKIRGFTPNSKTLCSMSDTTITQADVALGTGLATFSNVVGMNNSRVFQTNTNTQITGSNIRFITNNYSTLLFGTNFNVKYINSTRASAGDGIGNAAAQGITSDVFTYDLKVLDINGTPISGAAVQLTNISGSTIFNTTTNLTGSISQQEVTLFTRNILSGSGPVENLSPFTLTVFKDGYNEYKETTIYSSSIALEKTIALTETGSILTINLL